MSDPSEFGHSTADGGPAKTASPMPNRQVALIGSVIAGASTLAAAISLKDLFQNDPFLALAVFAVMASFLTFVVALVSGITTSRLWPVVAFSVALLIVGVGAGLVSWRGGPRQIALDISATPPVQGTTIRLAGRPEVVGWDKGTPIMLQKGSLTLDLNDVARYYELEYYRRCSRQLVPELGGGQGTPKSAGEPS